MTLKVTLKHLHKLPHFAFPTDWNSVTETLGEALLKERPGYFNGQRLSKYTHTGKGAYELAPRRIKDIFVGAKRVAIRLELAPHGAKVQIVEFARDLPVYRDAVERGSIRFIPDDDKRLVFFIHKNIIITGNPLEGK